MKPIVFLGDSLLRLRAFPVEARCEAGFQLREVQKGGEPRDWKPLGIVGTGVREIRIRSGTGAFRIVYLAKLADRVLVLHASEKKTQKTSQRDIDLATARLREWR